MAFIYFESKSEKEGYDVFVHPATKESRSILINDLEQTGYS